MDNLGVHGSWIMFVMWTVHRRLICYDTWNRNKFQVNIQKGEFEL